MEDILTFSNLFTTFLKFSRYVVFMPSSLYTCLSPAITCTLSIKNTQEIYSNIMVRPLESTKYISVKYYKDIDYKYKLIGNLGNQSLFMTH